MAAIPKTAWKKLLPKPDPKFGSPCERSSHGFSVLKGGKSMILYGGEQVARTPLDSNQSAWALDSLENNEWQWRWIDPAKSSAVPPERVAHAQAVHKDNTIYVFGGRAGITMQEKAMNDLWKLDCSGSAGSEQWSLVTPTNSAPEERSFHKMICVGDALYVFGGCSAHHGRLADIHKFDINTSTWIDLGSSSVLRGRGGPNLMSFAKDSKLGIVAGFAGEETNDGDFFHLDTMKWNNKETDDAEFDLTSNLSGMRPRSVCVSAAFPSLGVSVVFGGEVDPSEKGHEGAGGFESDIVLLNESNGKYLETIPRVDGDGWPTVRGWSDGDSTDDGNGNGMLYVYGGLSGDDSNPKRLDDLWCLELTK